MPRPDFPNPYCILTPEMISRINDRQQEYDRDPEGWERREHRRAEERRQEEEAEREAMEEDYRRQADQAAQAQAEQENYDAENS